MQETTAVQSAVAAAGSQTNLAKALGITPQAVQRWVTQGYVPAFRVIEVAAATGVAAEELALDLVRAIGRGAVGDSEGGDTD